MSWIYNKYRGYLLNITVLVVHLDSIYLTDGTPYFLAGELLERCDKYMKPEIRQQLECI